MSTEKRIKTAISSEDIEIEVVKKLNKNETKSNDSLLSIIVDK